MQSRPEHFRFNFVATVNDAAFVPVNAEKMTAGIATCDQLAVGFIESFFGGFTGQQLATEQTAGTGFGRNVALRAIDDRRKKSVLVDAGPGSARFAVNAADHAGTPRLDTRCLGLSIEPFFPVHG